MNNFTVMELRDAIIRECKDETDMTLRDCVFWSKDTTDSGGKAPHILKQRLQ